LWELACLRWSSTITRANWMNAAHLNPSPAGWLLQVLHEKRRGRGPLWELACQRWSLTITRANWMTAAHLSPSPAGWLLQVLHEKRRGRGPLWELACRVAASQRWSSTITRANWMNAAHLNPSPAGWLLQVLRYRCFPGLCEEPFSLAGTTSANAAKHCSIERRWLSAYNANSSIVERPKAFSNAC